MILIDGCRLQRPEQPYVRPLCISMLVLIFRCTHACEGCRIGPKHRIKIPGMSGIGVLYPHAGVCRSSRLCFRGASCLRSYSTSLMWVRLRMPFVWRFEIGVPVACFLPVGWLRGYRGGLCSSCAWHAGPCGVAAAKWPYIGITGTMTGTLCFFTQ